MGKVKRNVRQKDVNRHCNMHMRLWQRIHILKRENRELKMSNTEVVRKMNKVRMEQANSSEETHTLLTSNISLLMEHNHSLEKVNQMRDEIEIVRREMSSALNLLGNFSETLLSMSKRLNNMLVITQENNSKGTVSSPIIASDKRVNRSKPVCPMVRGHLIQKPTISLKRLNIPYTCPGPDTNMMALSPIQEEHSFESGSSTRQRGRLGKRQFCKIPEVAASVEELMVPIVRLRVLSDSWLPSLMSSEEQNERGSVISEEQDEVFRGWPPSSSTDSNTSDTMDGGEGENPFPCSVVSSRDTLLHPLQNEESHLKNEETTRMREQWNYPHTSDGDEPRTVISSNDVSPVAFKSVRSQGRRSKPQDENKPNTRKVNREKEATPQVETMRVTRSSKKKQNNNGSRFVAESIISLNAEETNSRTQNIKNENRSQEPLISTPISYRVISIKKGSEKSSKKKPKTEKRCHSKEKENEGVALIQGTPEGVTKRKIKPKVFFE